MSDSRKLFEYFVTVGLKEGAEELVISAQECGRRNATPLAPITDICVIFPSLGEKVPDGFECIESTPSGHPADLNYGSIRTPPVFICYRRGYHKPPLVDIGVLDEGRGEKPMLDSNIVQTTPFGRPANVNNASQVSDSFHSLNLGFYLHGFDLGKGDAENPSFKSGIYLTYRRAQPNNPPSQLVVTNICVIIADKGDMAPHTYYKIPKNLNKGMVGSDIFLCYKKSQAASKRIAYTPAVLNRFPEDSDFRLVDTIPMFCLPMGALIECWPTNCQNPEETFSTFVLTDQNGCKFYGASVSFYELYKKKLTEEQLEKLEISSPSGSVSGTALESTGGSGPVEQMSFHYNTSICVISRYPFFNAFKRFLFFIHHMSVSGTYSVPIERYVSHLMYEVSFPSPRCPHVIVQLGNEAVSLDSYDDSQLPLSGAALSDALKCLGPENLIYIVLLALLEQKILVHSLRPWLLTTVAESVCALTFPFHWQCPYIPQCPLSLAGVLHAPLPFIAGVDSRYFDLYEDPPPDVTCFDLDTAIVSQSTTCQNKKLSLLPKLKTTLEKLHKRIHREESSVFAPRRNNTFTAVSIDLQTQQNKRLLEVKIQDAFLRFMASLMQGYTRYLKPIRSAPRHVGATDTVSLFDLDAFLRSRDKSSAAFFKRFCETQLFNRFIEERSFVSDKNAFNAFFDECIDKVRDYGGKSSEPILLNAGLPESSQTEITMPPESFKAPDGSELSFTYSEFPRQLNSAYFHFKVGGISSALHRTKQEWRSSLEELAMNIQVYPSSWPKALLFYSYSLWFMLLPSLLHLAISKIKILRLAFHILDRMEQSGITPFDQVCYRTVIQLCGEMEQPHLAVQVEQAMHRSGLELNAVTYGIYHEAILKQGWPGGSRSVAIKAWRKLALVVRGVSKFKSGLLIKGRGDVQQEIDHSEPNKSCNGDSCKSATDDKNTDCSESEDKQPQPEKLSKGDEAENSDQRSDSVPFVISVHPLPAESDTSSTNQGDSEEPVGVDALDPLGALSPEHIKKCEKKKNIATEFMTEREKVKRNEKPSSWFKGLANSPIVSKFMRSNTSGKFGSSDSLSDALLISPGLTSLVAQMKKGYDGVIQSSNFSSLREGVSTFVNEVRGRNRTHAKDLFGSSSSIEPQDHDEAMQLVILQQNPECSDPLFQLDSGTPCSILPSDWWVEDQIFAANSLSSPLDVTISSASLCSNCKTVIYDDDIMAGWSADDSNLNTTCVYCGFSFVPSLSIRLRTRSSFVKNSWYAPSVFNTKDDFANSEGDTETNEIAETVEDHQVPFVSPLVLRREIENLLNGDALSLADPGLQHSHPIIFWNLIYYTRRIALPTHLCSWLGSSVHVRCVYDVPEKHTSCKPLYFSNNVFQEVPVPDTDRSVAVWEDILVCIQQSSIFRGLTCLLKEHGWAPESGKLRPHFSLYRDLQFVALNRFGRAVCRDTFDYLYQLDFERLPPTILVMLPKPDHPLSITSRLCKRIFLPLDVC
ncbi:unnamed protein product [Enterobius vermicularis]|uniref:C-myc promoter-binding protein n=1 Tax=Enterobius vermicularis TaxID=51028 RepID=A0A0N4UY15_ENTVE|nr:unnamed protein product [Enterobius vermicularis]